MFLPMLSLPSLVPLSRVKLETVFILRIFTVTSAVGEYVEPML